MNTEPLLNYVRPSISTPPRCAERVRVSVEAPARPTPGGLAGASAGERTRRGLTACNLETLAGAGDLG